MCDPFEVQSYLWSVHNQDCYIEVHKKKSSDRYNPVRKSLHIPN